MGGWEEEWHILSCLQELAWKALHFPGSFVKVFPLSIDAHSSKTPCWTRTFILQAVTYDICFSFFFFFLMLLWHVPLKRELGHVRPRGTTQSLRQPRKSLSWKETSRQDRLFKDTAVRKGNVYTPFYFCSVLYTYIWAFFLFQLLLLTSLH